MEIKQKVRRKRNLEILLIKKALKKIDSDPIGLQVMRGKKIKAYRNSPYIYMSLLECGRLVIL